MGCFGCGCSGSGGCGGSGCGDSSGTIEVVVVVVVVVVMSLASPTICQHNDSGMFQLYASCNSTVRVKHFVVNMPVWLQGTESMSLASLTTSHTCTLEPGLYKVRTGLFVVIESRPGGQEGTGVAPLCTLPKRAMLELRQGVVRVSCFNDQSSAEAEMLYSRDNITNTSFSTQGSTTHPGDDTNNTSISTQGSTRHSAQQNEEHTSTTRPQTHEPFDTPTHEPHTGTPKTPMPQVRSGKAIDTSRTHGTSEESTSSLSSTVETTTSSGHLTDVEDVTVEEEAEEITGETTNNYEAEDIPRKERMKKENLTIADTIPDNDSLNSEQIIYFAGAGAGVLALIIGVIAVVWVTLHRQRKAKAEKEKEDYFISGGYSGTMEDSTRSGDNNKNGYLNAHVMFYSYSGAEREITESYEMEERALNSSVSYSSHDIPKCLKEEGSCSPSLPKHSNSVRRN